MENSLAKISEVDQLLPTVDVLKNMKQVADWMVNAKMLPPGYKDGSDLMVVALRGREMGVPMGQAIQGMFPMKGRIGYMGGFLLSRVLQILPDSQIKPTVNTKERCVLTCRRDRNSEAVDVEFTMAEAIACNYHQNWDSNTNAWKPKATWKDQANMLYWRCVSRAINRVFPDVFGAPVYQADELQDTEAIDIAPKGKAAANVPYETAVVADPKVDAPAVIVDAEIIPGDTAGPIVEAAPVEEEPHKDNVDDSKPKMNQQLQDTLITQLEKDMWGKNCTTKKHVEEIFEAFKKTGAPGKLLTTGFKLKVKRLEEIGSRK